MKVPEREYLQKHSICFVSLGGNEICGKLTKNNDYRCPKHRKEWDDISKQNDRSVK